ncbi:enoyl-CoA hydratase/isomerase family protein [Saccharospirillum impatiens]|uniref:enoyl-CoA hydratase/isomerase family protein n=1 Tax=Saccharospirillum impatiens TaxID=169438 RepID=UPI0003F8DED2|nr:enoyl-CoA hydratase/isomerase family protein [Saccharospirillum impatiens]
MNETLNVPLQTEQLGALRVICLHRPKALNALDLGLIEALDTALTDAFADESVSSIWLQSTQARAFCAGGDVKALYQAAVDQPADVQRAEAIRYFSAEYQLDAKIEHSPKPIVMWGRGVVMGGGWGLFAGGDLKLIDADARFAMPELQIGLFPDVGAAHFLQQPDWRAGTLIGCSGIHLTAKDVLALGYADACLDENGARQLKDWLAAGGAPSDWVIPALSDEVAERRDDWYSALDALPAPNLSDWMAHIDVSTFEPFRQAKQQWQSGSSLSVALTWHHFRRLRRASRVEALNEDLMVGAHAVAEREFLEGVRALLVDKDKSPAWLYPGIISVPMSLIDRFYRPVAGAPLISVDAALGGCRT